MRYQQLTQKRTDEHIVHLGLYELLLTFSVA